MNSLLLNAEKYVYNLLNTEIDTQHVFHNLAHTQRVVAKAKEIADYLKIEKIDAENLEIAALFHDTGYVNGIDNHEEKSIEIASSFLQEHNVAVDRITAICNLIMATNMHSKPKNDLEKIIKDADCAHLGSKNFFEYTSLLRKEWELTGLKKASDVEWLSTNIDFFTKKHRFYTIYALKKWTKTKQKNLTKLLKEKEELQETLKKFHQKEEIIKIKKNKGDVPERGVETMFRVALRNHITLSDIADTKANILLSVNAIIISLALSNLLPKLDNPSNQHLFIPTIIFVVFTVASIVLSILATRPNVTEGKFTKEDVANKKVNLLFFGNFHKMSLEEFEWGMKEMMKDKDYLYGSLTKDLYFLGLVLNRKYSILRLTYTVFMIGILVSVVAFAVSFYYQGMPTR